MFQRLVKNNLKFRRNQKAFTLVEVIVTLAILSSLIVIIAGLASYTAGKLRSIQQRNMNYALRSALDLVGQKMYSANDKVTIPNGSSPITVYGFRYYKSGDPTDKLKIDANMIVIVSSYDDSPVVKKCTFFGYDSGDQNLKMGQNNCDSFLILADLKNSVLPKNIKLTSFVVQDGSNLMTDPTDIIIPKIMIDATVQDQQGTVKSELQTTFSMDGYNVKGLQS